MEDYVFVVVVTNFQQYQLALLPRLREISISRTNKDWFGMNDDDRKRLIKIASLRSLRPSLHTPLQLRFTNFVVSEADEQKLRKHFIVIRQG